MKDFLHLKFLVFLIFTNLAAHSAVAIMITVPSNGNYCERQQGFLLVNLNPQVGISDNLQQQKTTAEHFNLTYEAGIFALPARNDITLHKNSAIKGFTNRFAKCKRNALIFV